MLQAENVWKAYKSREAATEQDGGWAKWAADNKALSDLLVSAMIAAEATEDNDHTS